MNFDGFDWDEGNLEKCCKHGVTVAQIEAVFANDPLVLADSGHSDVEARFHAIGTSGAARPVFLVFTYRVIEGARLLRPISARYMHAQEIAFYEKEISGSEER